MNQEDKNEQQDEINQLPAENSQNEDENEEKSSLHKRNVIFFLILLILIFFSVFSLTYSIYKGDLPDDHTIITGDLSFSYSDADYGNGGSAIKIIGALPMSDSYGKSLNGKTQRFDFSVTATAKSTNLLYKLYIKKGANSTLKNSDLRIYLVSLNSGVEEELLLDTLSNLKEEKINGETYYVLYEKRLNKGIDNYSDSFRLRMWVKEDATDYFDKVFSLKIVAHAEQAKD